jgi:large subunit ribosomal protein L9
MKVILNKDLATLGEEGDVKDVAKGYARNYLFPRGIALPYNNAAIKLFEARKEDIEARKAEKRRDASGLKEKIEALTPLITMPAGANGRLYGAVTSQTIVEELAKQGFQIERKRIEVPGNTFKSVGKFKVIVKLYENESAELTITVEGQQIKTETKAPAHTGGRRRGGPAHEAAPAAAASEPGETPPGETPAGGAAADAPSEPASAEDTATEDTAAEDTAASVPAAGDTAAE